MSRHRFVRNLDLDGKYFTYSLRWVTRAHLLQKSATMALFPTVEMISHQRNMVWLVSFSVLPSLLRCPIPLVFSSTRSRARERPRNSWFRGAIRVHRFLHQRNPLGLLLRRRKDSRMVIGYVLYSSSGRKTDPSQRGAGEEERCTREKR